MLKILAPGAVAAIPTLARPPWRPPAPQARRPCWRTIYHDRESEQGWQSPECPLRSSRHSGRFLPRPDVIAAAQRTDDRQLRRLSKTEEFGQLGSACEKLASSAPEP
jgi:hypothetical protein